MKISLERKKKVILRWNILTGKTHYEHKLLLFFFPFPQFSLGCNINYLYFVAFSFSCLNNFADNLSSSSVCFLYFQTLIKLLLLRQLRIRRFNWNQKKRTQFKWIRYFFCLIQRFLFLSWFNNFHLVLFHFQNLCNLFYWIHSIFYGKNDI